MCQTGAGVRKLIFVSAGKLLLPGTCFRISSLQEEMDQADVPHAVSAFQTKPSTASSVDVKLIFVTGCVIGCT